MRRCPSRVEDYTIAFLVSTGLVLFMGLFTLAATKGFLWVMVAAALIDLLLRAGEVRLAASKAAADSSATTAPEIGKDG